MHRWYLKFFVGLLLVSAINLSVSAAPLVVPPYPENVSVKMYELTDTGANMFIPCSFGNKNFGCTAFCNNYGVDTCEMSVPAVGYPYSGGTIAVFIERYNLLDVVSQEMNPNVDDGQPDALESQAIASRSYLGWKINNDLTNIDNSGDFNQVFVPYKFDSLNPGHTLLEKDNYSPCLASFLSPEQQRVCDAIASKYYIAKAVDNPENLPAFAEFTSDVLEQTRDHPEMATQFPYLKGVKDSISTTCDSNDSGIHLAGLSSQGAVRWAKGDRCYDPDEGIMPWRVTWDRAEQILFHYYTNVHLRDATGSKLSPDYRWNPLNLENLPSVMMHGGSYTVKVELQNTGTIDWTCGTYSYQLRYRWVKGSNYLLSVRYASLCNLPIIGNFEKGEDGEVDIIINDLPAWGIGGYTLKFDVRRYTSWGEEYYFSNQSPSWPTYNVTIFAATHAINLPVILNQSVAR